MEREQSNKPHRKAKEKKKHTGDRNPKAFAFAHPGRLQRAAARSHDIKEKRFHVPQVDRLPDAPPPRLVAVVGPPSVGKTTLLKSLIRRYAKETMSEPLGPITVITSKKQRLTFVECPNQLEAMVDMAKVADIVLLMIDGNYGFEMETLEFLNILAATGMPGNIFSILTHLDLFRKPQTLKDTKKRLKDRLWKELYHGAHLFYLSGVINGRYPDREVHNISRFLSQMKNPRPLIWRNTHPYSVIDNVRDITHPTAIEEDPTCDRTIVLSGYLRGTNFAAQGQRVHIPGLGDFTVSDMEALPDPCPTPDMERDLARLTGKTGSGRRRLDEKEKKLHAPMSDRSGLKIEGDAVWITRDRGFNFDKDAEEGDAERGEGEELIIGLQSERKLLGQTEDGVQLFAGGRQIKETGGEGDGASHRRVRLAEFSDDEDLPEDEGFVSGEDDEVDGDDENSDFDGDEEEEFEEKKLGRIFRGNADKENGDLAFADADSDLGSLSSESERDGESDDESDLGDEDEADGDEPSVRWKSNMVARANRLHGKRIPYQAADLSRLLYKSDLTPAEVIRKWTGEEDEEAAEADDDDEFFKRPKAAVKSSDDRMAPLFDYEELSAKWSLAENLERLRLTRFATTKSSKANGDDDEDGFGSEEDEGEGDDDDDEEDDEGDGAFEDLETGEQHGPINVEAERAKQDRKREEFRQRFEEEDREGLFNDKANARREGGETEEFGEDDWYDEQKAAIKKQLDINKEEFENIGESQRVAMEGYRAGKYAKIIIQGIPAEFMDNFQARLPLIVGGLTPTEDRFGFVQVRIKRHRWHKKILKTHDPLIFSLGWRRFQTLPLYSISDSRARNRMLKYTPEHMHCFATFYGPLVAPNTGFVCFNSFSPSNPGFRVAASGTVLGVDESVEVVKKLKLTGTPYKIFKNTAFIKGMFNTSLEVAKFEGAAVKTVSGIRGQIKRALSKPEGHLRATFEDKVLASDIVFMQAWHRVNPHRFYNPVTNLLGDWRRMRLTGEVRADEGVPTPLRRNSQYRDVARETRRFNPLRVPRQLAAELPYKSQMVRTAPQKKPTYMQQRRAVIVTSKEERKKRDLDTKLATIHKDMREKRKAEKAKKQAEFIKGKEAVRERVEERERRDKQAYWKREGRKRKAGGDGGGGGKRRK